jgi:hypothetical protein
MDGMTINHIVSIDHGSYTVDVNSRLINIEMNMPLMNWGVSLPKNDRY